MGRERNETGGTAVRPLEPGEEEEALDLVRRSFQRFVAPDLPPEGIEEFARYVRPEAFRERLAGGHFALVATAGGAIVGVAEVLEDRHLSLLFVDPDWRGKGVGEELLRRAVARCRERAPAAGAITVHSGLGAVGFYERMGFRRTGPERLVNGIRFVPMELVLEES